MAEAVLPVVLAEVEMEKNPLGLLCPHRLVPTNINNNFGLGGRVCISK